MKITKRQLKRIIKEEKQKLLHEQRGGYGTMTSREVEQMLQRNGWDTRGREGEASILQKRALEQNISKNDLELLFRDARISHRDTARQVFQKLGLRY
jgi:hypothetical protein